MQTGHRPCPCSKILWSSQVGLDVANLRGTRGSPTPPILIHIIFNFTWRGTRGSHTPPVNKLFLRKSIIHMERKHMFLVNLLQNQTHGGGHAVPIHLL